MLRLLKYLFYLSVICGALFLAYAYLGPIFGADFSPVQEEVVIPLTLDVN